MADQAKSDARAWHQQTCQPGRYEDSPKGRIFVNGEFRYRDEFSAEPPVRYVEPDDCEEERRRQYWREALHYYGDSANRKKPVWRSA